MRSIIIVFVGSGTGGVLRYLAGLAALRWFRPSYPVGTMAINIVGSALLGGVAGALAARSGGSMDVRLLLTTGLIAGFTTWSTFTLDALTLWQRGSYTQAASYVLGSFVLSMVAIAATASLARRILAA